MNVAGLTYADTGDLLAMMAPRALLVVSATQDALQFSVGEAAKSVAHARTRYRALNADERLKHLPIESKHDYGRPMREAMYGWLERWLRGKGDGSPVAEPEHRTEDPQVLRCYPDGPSRPKTIVTIPEFALREGRERLKALPSIPDHRERWEADAAHLRAVLNDLVHVPPAGPAEPAITHVDLAVRPEGGLVLRGRLLTEGGREDKPSIRTLLLRHAGEARPDEPAAAALQAIGRAVATVDLRATGRGKPDSPVIAGVGDHNEAEWGLWIGRPLLFQWVRDAIAWIDAVAASDPLRRARGIEVVGVGPFGLVALIAAALRNDRISRVGWIDPLVSFVGADATAWAGLPMGLIAPDILGVADVAHLAALVAPKPLVLAGGVEPSGSPASAARRAEAFAYARAAYRVLGAPDGLTLLDSPDTAGFVRALAGAAAT
jgi:hypothetical protein